MTKWCLRGTQVTYRLIDIRVPYSRGALVIQKPRDPVQRNNCHETRQKRHPTTYYNDSILVSILWRTSWDTHNNQRGWNCFIQDIGRALFIKARSCTACGGPWIARQADIDSEHTASHYVTYTGPRTTQGSVYRTTRITERVSFDIQVYRGVDGIIRDILTYLLTDNTNEFRETWHDDASDEWHQRSRRTARNKKKKNTTCRSQYEHS